MVPSLPPGGQVRSGFGTALLAAVLLAGCVVRRPVAQPLSEARYFYAEEALAKANDRVAGKILDKLPKAGRIVVALPPTGGERQGRLVRSILFAGLSKGRDIRLVPHASAYAPENASWPVVEVVTLAAGPELPADPPPRENRSCSIFHVAVLVRVHQKGQLLWSEILRAKERELPLVIPLELEEDS